MFKTDGHKAVVSFIKESIFLRFKLIKKPYNFIVG